MLLDLKSYYNIVAIRTAFVVLAYKQLYEPVRQIDMTNWFSTKLIRRCTWERTFFQINGAEKFGYSYAQEWNHTSVSSQIAIQNELDLKIIIYNHKTIRRNHMKNASNTKMRKDFLNKTLSQQETKTKHTTRTL